MGKLRAEAGHWLDRAAQQESPEERGDVFPTRKAKFLTENASMREATTGSKGRATSRAAQTKAAVSSASESGSSARSVRC